MRPDTAEHGPTLERIAVAMGAWQDYREGRGKARPPRPEDIPIDIAVEVAGDDQNLACALLADGLELSIRKGLYAIPDSNAGARSNIRQSKKIARRLGL